MAGLVPAIHVLLRRNVARKSWMPATSAGMTAPVIHGFPYTFERLRIMKVSLEYSATCHHRYWSLRKSVIAL
jgi:hypothetical protein